jgi:hypothetical protein
VLTLTRVGLLGDAEEAGRNERGLRDAKKQPGGQQGEMPICDELGDTHGDCGERLRHDAGVLDEAIRQEEWRH